MREAGRWCVVAVLLGAGAVTGCGKDCHSARTGPTALAAVEAYYDGCSAKPTAIRGPTDADVGGPFTSDRGRALFSVDVGGTIRFIQAERSEVTEPWRVTGDFSGP